MPPHMIEPADVGATRAAYDTVASDYAALLRDELQNKPVDRAVLAAFAELVKAAGDEPVGDIGCGPGRIANHLASLGVPVFGIDLSSRMIEVARRDYPTLTFRQGSMESLDLADESLSGVVAWYSIIHTPPERLPGVFAEFSRVLITGGLVLLAFQAGDEPRHIQRAYGHDISLDAYRLAPDWIESKLRQAGLVEESRLIREPDETERTPQAFITARKI